MAGSRKTLTLEDELAKKGYVLSSVLGEGSYGKVRRCGGVWWWDEYE